MSHNQKSNQARIKSLFIDNVQSSYYKACKETDLLKFSNLKIHLHHATIIKAFQKAQMLNNVDKFEFYTNLKNIYMKEYIDCWNVCVYEISKISNNSEKVQEHINNHSFAVESILYTYLNDSLKEYFENALERKKEMIEHFSTKLEKISMDQVKEKLKTLLSTYIEGFLNILSEK
jgi:UTP:GlnB (protein PII) uridylyltransferase